jgi:phosphoenolpyruvate synthase/pyruvate phosphate dikinase
MPTENMKLSPATILEASIRIELARLANLMDAIGQGQPYVDTVIEIARMQDELNAALVAAYEAERTAS